MKSGSWQVWPTVGVQEMVTTVTGPWRPNLSLPCPTSLSLDISLRTTALQALFPTPGLAYPSQDRCPESPSLRTLPWGSWTKPS